MKKQIEYTTKLMNEWGMFSQLSENEREMIIAQLNSIANAALSDARSMIQNEMIKLIIS